jgi:hypothetical protein
LSGAEIALRSKSEKTTAIERSRNRRMKNKIRRLSAAETALRSKSEKNDDD